MENVTTLFCALKSSRAWRRSSCKKKVVSSKNRILDHLGKIQRYREMQPIGFDQDTYPHACVTGGDEVLTLFVEKAPDADVDSGDVKKTG